MSQRNPLPVTHKVAVAGLVVAAVGVLVQVLSGHDYPPIPPVYFILLTPAGLIAFARWRWAPIPAVLAGLFLTVGLFASGESGRLVDLNTIGGTGSTIGLWVQTVAVIIATVAAILATIRNYRPGERNRATDESFRY